MRSEHRTGWMRGAFAALLAAGLLALGCATDVEVERTTLPHVDDKPAATQEAPKKNDK